MCNSKGKRQKNAKRFAKNWNYLSKHGNVKLFLHFRVTFFLKNANIVYLFLGGECLLTRLPHLKCIWLVTCA